MPKRIAGWQFKHVRRLLRQDRGQGFVLPELLEAFTVEQVEELPSVVRRLVTLGCLKEDAPGWWQVTDKGRELREQSQRRVSRRRALELIDEFKVRITEVNGDEKYAYKVKVAAVFGSVLDDKDMFGDVDVAIELVARHPNIGDQEKTCAQSISRAPNHIQRSFIERLFWPRVEVKRALVGKGRGRVSIRDLDELELLFKAEPKRPKYEVVFGAWKPPKRPKGKPVDLPPKVWRLLARLAKGQSIRRLRSGPRAPYLVGSTRISEQVVERLRNEGCLVGPLCTSDATSVTEQWVVSSTAHAALSERAKRTKS